MVLVLGGGRLVEHRRFGTDLGTASTLIERDVRLAVEGRGAALRTITRQLAGSRDVAGALARPKEPADALFDVLERASGPDGPPDLALIAYSAAWEAVAWHGRPAALPRERMDGPASVFVAAGPLGLRLVYVEPVASRTRHPSGWVSSRGN